MTTDINHENKMESKKLEIPKCYVCKKPTDLICAECGIGLCSKHNGYIHHQFYCASCFVKVQKRGITQILIWFSILIVGALITFFTISKPI